MTWPLKACVKQHGRLIRQPDPDVRLLFSQTAAFIDSILLKANYLCLPVQLSLPGHFDNVDCFCFYWTAAAAAAPLSRPPPFIVMEMFSINLILHTGVRVLSQHTLSIHV